MNNEEIKRLIKQRYSTSAEKTKIADLCLELGRDWAKVVGKDLDKYSARQAKKNCSRYIQENFDRSKVKGGILVTIFLSVIIKIISNWIADMIIDKKQ